QKNIREIQQGISFTGVGITFKQDEKTTKISISALFPNAPAIKAGLLPQDALLKVNGESVEGLNVNQVRDRLRGATGSPVTLTVGRDNQSLDFQLIRTRISIRPKHRSPEAVIKDSTTLINYLGTVQTRLTGDLEKLKTLEQQIAEGKADPVETLTSLVGYFDKQQAQLLTEAEQTIALSQQLLQGQPDILRDWNAYLDATVRLKVCADAVRPKNNARELGILVERMNATARRELTEPERLIWDEQDKLIVQLVQLVISLDCNRDAIAQMDLKKDFQQNLQSAREQSSQFGEALEIWRKRLAVDADRIEAQEQGQKTFQQLVKFLVELNQPNEALVASEKSRARAFADLLATRLSPSSTLSTRSPSITMEQMQKVATAQNAILIQYSVIDDGNLYIWVIYPNGKVGFRQVKSSSRGSLNDLVIGTRTAMGVDRATLITHAPGVLKLDKAKQTQQLQKLHKLLIEPISDLLPTDPKQNVIFIPQGALFSVPFAALQDQNGTYLIEKHTILTAPSIQVLDLTHQQKLAKKGDGKQTALVVGNPLMPLYQDPQDPQKASQLPPLKGAEAEARDIAPLLHTTAITGAQATKSAITKQMGSAGIIHLATHGILDNQSGLSSAIALAPDHPGTPNDGLLTAAEILEMKLHADLVVLSACDTGRGRITGDGVIGLSRSLITAGVPSVIVSLWSVPDAPTATLMTEFYQQLDRSLNKAQALRQAMLTTMKTHPNPIDWAAFTLIGEAQ
ncbi:MAG: CHAT domain-containing protein, partial [Kovacikia sp.]